MYKPSFGVVSGVVVVLAILAVLSKLVIGLIPDGPPNGLALETSEFLLQAAHEEIDWHTLTEDTFAYARKQEKPIMLVVGSACSPAGRAADKVVFPTKEVRGFLARNFICVRVDVMARPEFMNAFLPLSRAALLNGGRLAIPPDYQVWFLDPKGYVFGYAAETVQGRPLDPRAFLADLEDAANRFDRIQSGKEKAGVDQGRDLAVLEAQPQQVLPDLAGFAEFLRESTATGVGGFPINGYQRLWPSAWEFQLRMGRFADYAQSILPCLQSPDVDVLDGGFFTGGATMDWRGIGYDKLTVVNAAMLKTLALGAGLMRSPDQRWLALRTFDALLTQFPRDGLLATGQVGDEGNLGRSTRCSFSPRQLRALLPESADREWARVNLGLRVETNPQMTPMLANIDTPLKDTSRFQAVVDALSKGRPSPKVAGLADLDVGGFATARMMESARLLGDRQRLVKAEGLFERLDAFRSLNDVVHSQATGARPSSYLGDYLAYADGALQYFLATGDIPTLQNGIAVLRRGLFLYGGSIRGLYRLSQPPSTSNAPQDAASPEIVDNIRESCTAQVIRLGSEYGRLLGDHGADFTRASNDALTRFAPICPSLGQYAAGFYCAAAEVQDAAYAVTVGPDAMGLAARLARLAPGRLVAPSFGPVKAPGEGVGVYVIRALSVQGPMTPEQAAATFLKASTGSR